MSKTLFALLVSSTLLACAVETSPTQSDETTSELTVQGEAEHPSADLAVPSLGNTPIRGESDVPAFDAKEIKGAAPLPELEVEKAR